jgi:hypothetical protein
MGLAHHPHDQIRSISLDGIYLKDEQLTPYHSDEYMLRLVRDLAGSADHRRAGPQSGAGHRRHVQDPARSRRRRDQHHRRRHRIAQRVAAPGQGVVPPRWIRRMQTLIRRIPSAGSIAAFSKPIRSGDCGSTSATRFWSECIRPIWPTSSKI